MKKAWRIIRAILMLICMLVALVAGYFSFESGAEPDTTMFPIFVVCCVLGLPTLIKMMAQEYTGKPEPKRFVRNRLIVWTVLTFLLSSGVYWLCTFNQSDKEWISEYIGDYRWLFLMLIGIFALMFFVIEIFMFYLPRRLGLEEGYDNEEDEAEANRVSTVLGILVSVLFVAVGAIPVFVPEFNDYINPTAFVWVMSAIVSLGIVGYFLREKRKEDEKQNKK